MAAVLAHADPVHKVTILPSGMALGTTQQLPMNERHLYERGYLLDTLAVRLAGRVAEELTCDDISSGAANDLAEATSIATQMVRDWAMTDELGPVAWSGSQPPGGAAELVGIRPYSEETAHTIDAEIQRLLTEQHERARQILCEHRTALDAVAEGLIEHETLSGDAVSRIVRETAPAAGLRSAG